MNNYGYEIDFIAVGNGEKGGDAIGVRYGNLFSNSRDDYKVIIIDGGTKDSGNELINHVQNYYHTDKVDLQILTHPDIDHASGAIEIADRLDVKKIWMHRPWANPRFHSGMFRDGRITDNSIKERFKSAFKYAYQREEKANEKNIPIVEPYTGISYDDTIFVLGPNKPFYVDRILECEKTPEPLKSFSGFVQEAFKATKTAYNWVRETIDRELLTDEGETSPVNETSVITFFKIGDRKILLTGDAGQFALKNAIDYAKTKDFSLKDLNFLQIPHHGSRRNIGPSILSEITGNTAYISAPKEGDPKHPSRRVINALIRRNVNVFTTKGSSKFHHHNSPSRNLSSAIPEQFYNTVEE